MPEELEYDLDDLDDDGMDEEEMYFAHDCHLDRNGFCGKSGSEECEFDCPFSHQRKG